MQENTEPTKPDQICKVFKLSSGETIICMVTKESPSYIEIEIPFRLNMMYTPHGTVNLAMFRWDHTISYDAPIRIYKNSIVAVGDPTDDMFENYHGMISREDQSDKEEDIHETSNAEMETLMTKLLQNFKSDKLH